MIAWHFKMSSSNILLTLSRGRFVVFRIVLNAKAFSHEFSIPRDTSTCPIQRLISVLLPKTICLRCSSNTSAHQSLFCQITLYGIYHQRGAKSKGQSPTERYLSLSNRFLESIPVSWNPGIISLQC